MQQELACALVRCWDLGRQGDARAARAEGTRLRRLALERGAQAEAATAGGMIAWFCLQSGDVESGLDHISAAKAFWAERGDANKEAWSRAVYAWLLLETGLTEEAAEEAAKASAQAELAGDAPTLSWALNVLGCVFWSCQQLDRSQALIERAVGIARAAGDRNILSWWLINEAGVHSAIGYRRAAQGDALASQSIRIALSINDEAIAVAREIGDVWSLRIALANSAEYFIAIDDLAAAAGAVDAWEALPEATLPREAGHILYTKGQLLTKQGRLPEALAVCADALALAKEMRNIDGESHALLYLSEIYEAMGRFDTALAFFKRFHEAQSRLVAEKVQRRARFAEIHYDTERFKQLAEKASRRAEQMAMTTMLDPLTGIGNRRRLDAAMERLRAEGKRFAIAVIDLDHFKAINDLYSHMVGDSVLKRVAGVLQACLCDGDSLARLGGEEFVVVMADCDLEAATTRCIALNGELARADWAGIDPSLLVTASIGVAVGDGGTDPSMVLALADQRLYMAKAAGRDRVVGKPGVMRLKRHPASAGYEGIALPGLAANARGIDVSALRQRLG